MRNLLFSLLVLATLAIFGLMVYQGISLGNLRIGYSIGELIAENNNLDNDIAKLGTKINTEYASAQNGLNASYTSLQAQKKTYQDKITYATEDELKALSMKEQYKIEYLWTKIGMYSKGQAIDIQLDVVESSSLVKNQFNINVTAIGEYSAISDFIYNVEKDDTLGFRIEEFKIYPDDSTIEKEEKLFNEAKSKGEIDSSEVFEPSNRVLKAEFKIKNIPIDPDSLSQYAQWKNPNGGSSTTNTNNNTDTEQTTNETSTGVQKDPVTGHSPNNIYDAMEEGGL